MRKSVCYAAKIQKMQVSFMEKQDTKYLATNVQGNYGKQSQGVPSVEGKLTA